MTDWKRVEDLRPFDVLPGDLVVVSVEYGAMIDGPIPVIDRKRPGVRVLLAQHEPWLRSLMINPDTLTPFGDPSLVHYEERAYQSSAVVEVKK